MRKKQVKHPNVLGVMVSAENIDIVERWCHGSIKGVLLSKDQQVIKLWSKLRDTELVACVGDFIVEVAPDVFEVYPPKLFHAMFKDVDKASW